MKSKTSFFKKDLILSDMKRFWWISVLYTIPLLFLLPLNHFIQKFSEIYPSNSEMLKRSIDMELGFVRSPSQLLLLVFPVFIGVLVFRYMQSGRSASFYHSLPVTRTSLFMNSLLSCTILFIIPLLITFLTMLLLNGFSFLSEYYTVHILIKWFLNSLLFGLMFIAMTVFAGMFTGNSIAQLAFVYILNVLPEFFAEFIRIHLCQLLFGFDNYSDLSFYNFMPMAMLFKSRWDKYTAATIIFFIILTVLLFVGALYAFKARKPETAGDIITFRPAKPVFIYGVTFCGTLLGGAYFGVIQGSFISLPFQIFGYFASALLSYVVVQMITNKTFRILNTWKGYVGYAVVLCVLLLCIRFDIFGYVNKIPAAADVEEVYIGYNLNYWLQKDNPDYLKGIRIDDDKTIFKAPKNIENITDLHKLILDKRSSEGNESYIAYRLKNGKTLIRHYVLDYDLYASALSTIYESDEYRNSRFPILHQEPDDLKYIEIGDNRVHRNPVIVSDKAQLEDFKAAVRKDIGTLGYSELTANSSRPAYIDIIDNKDIPVRYELRRCFTNTINWLKKEGLLEKVLIKPEDVSFVTLENYNYAVKDNSSPSDGANKPKTVKITDKRLIQELIDLSFEVDYTKNTSCYGMNFAKNDYENLSGASLSSDTKVSQELQKYIDQIK